MAGACRLLEVMEVAHDLDPGRLVRGDHEIEGILDRRHQFHPHDRTESEVVDQAARGPDLAAHAGSRFDQGHDALLNPGIQSLSLSLSLSSWRSVRRDAGGRPRGHDRGLPSRGWRCSWSGSPSRSRARPAGRRRIGRTMWRHQRAPAARPKGRSDAPFQCMPCFQSGPGPGGQPATHRIGAETGPTAPVNVASPLQDSGVPSLAWVVLSQAWCSAISKRKKRIR